MKTKAIILILTTSFFLSGCEKFLEEKSDKSIAIPTTLHDFQSLLHDWATVNFGFSAMGEASSDDIFLTDGDYNSLNYESDKRLYTWQPDYVSRSVSSAGNEWYKCYTGIYVSNSVLKGIEDNNLTGETADYIKGQALVFRAARYLDGVQIWAPVYNKTTANTDLGMVIRLEPDMNIPSERVSVQATYDQILKDLTDALPLLTTTSVAATLPNRSAAYGLLARTHLIMGNYAEALENAEKALEVNHQLIDFNNLNPNVNFPIPVTNFISSEIVFFTRMYASDLINANRARVSPSLYNLYEDGDLRKTVYFRLVDGSHAFKGTHTGSAALLTGISISELYLIVAECSARLDDLGKAEEALNNLLIKRWDTNQFIPYSFTDKDLALKTILTERRKELVFRGLRWSDIKRLNRDGYNITLSRTVNGQTITLPPHDLRYAIAIPEEIIELTEIQQNPR
ncbi:RagB/SusD family nutrient uptake outer membrane protein [Sphingobacterium sp. UDSM-2020]|uniref:RagB/SusD family nutrient uptake outer membrane protein n=1 Tax=Sphingobacterium sp. UDSM-2020 TaxID=2795738 RepID=UPI001936FB9A|nr:RagB/SusD family nutrient uptake outer membrane protein [Sphingobacterium sp. UDSM-2020]MBV2228492.1 RagB/SusD family nutrient uptake outer membrane protein [Sphingobacterium mizutaii]QQD14401.1 RagB/SusD family nutrient uptake outer membrane protein [Sphingobacterium sp. UDSM-2020]